MGNYWYEMVDVKARAGVVLAEADIKPKQRWQNNERDRIVNVPANLWKLQLADRALEKCTDFRGKWRTRKSKKKYEK